MRQLGIYFLAKLLHFLLVRRCVWLARDLVKKIQEGRHARLAQVFLEKNADLVPLLAGDIPFLRYHCKQTQNGPQYSFTHGIGAVRILKIAKDILEKKKGLAWKPVPGEFGKVSLIYPVIVFLMRSTMVVMPSRFLSLNTRSARLFRICSSMFRFL